MSKTFRRVTDEEVAREVSNGTNRGEIIKCLKIGILISCLILGGIFVLKILPETVVNIFLLTVCVAMLIGLISFLVWVFRNF